MGRKRKGTISKKNKPESDVGDHTVKTEMTDEKSLCYPPTPEGSDTKDLTPVKKRRKLPSRKLTQNASTEETHSGNNDNDREAMDTKMISDCAERFSDILRKDNENTESSGCSLWLDCPQITTVDSYRKLWDEESLMDVTLWLGPDSVPHKAHKLVLTARYKYFKSLFSTESTAEVRLPRVDPEDFRLILDFAYTGEANLTEENVFKKLFMAKHFGSDDLVSRCCNFIRNFINVSNCVELFGMASGEDIDLLKETCLLFILDHLPEVHKDYVSALSFKLLLEIFKHPAAVMIRGKNKKNEKQMFDLLWNKVKLSAQEERNDLSIEVLKAIHLPVIDSRFLFSLLREGGHIPEARELIVTAGESADASERKEWYLPRLSDNRGWVMSVFKRKKPIEVNGITSSEYSRCVLFKGFPFFIYATSRNEDRCRKEYHVASPTATEHLGLPYKVIVEIKNAESEWIPVNEYHNGVVVKRPMDESYKNEKGKFHMRVRFQKEDDPV